MSGTSTKSSVNATRINLLYTRISEEEARGARGHRHAAAVRAAGDRVAVVVDADLTRARALDENALAFGSLAGALASPETVDAAIIGHVGGLQTSADIR